MAAEIGREFRLHVRVERIEKIVGVARDVEQFRAGEIHLVGERTRRDRRFVAETIDFLLPDGQLLVIVEIERVRMDENVLPRETQLVADQAEGRQLTEGIGADIRPITARPIVDLQEAFVRRSTNVETDLQPVDQRIVLETSVRLRMSFDAAYLVLGEGHFVGEVVLKWIVPVGDLISDELLVCESHDNGIFGRAGGIQVAQDQ